MIAIVGGGVSGLALGAALVEREIDHLVLEADPRVGGLIGTVAVEGRPLELGPQRVRWGPELARWFGDAPRPPRLRSTTPEGLSVVRNGTLRPLPRSATEALRTPILSPAGRLRAMLEPLLALLHDPGEASAGDVLRRRFGDEAYRSVVGPFFGGLYGSDPDDMDFRRTLGPALGELGVRGRSFVPLLRQLGGWRGSRPLPSAVVPPGGMATLMEALRLRQSDRVRTEAPVKRIEPSPGGGVRLRLEGGEVIDAEQVVVTTPPWAAARLLAEISPEVGRRLRGLTMNRLVLVHLLAEALPGGLGYQVAFGERLRTRGVTFAGNLSGFPGLAVAFLGGRDDREAWEVEDRELARTAVREFRQVTGMEARALHVHRAAMPAWDRSWDRLDGMTLPEGVHLLTNYTGRPGIPGRLKGARELADALATEKAAR